MKIVKKPIATIIQKSGIYESSNHVAKHNILINTVQIILIMKNIMILERSM